jgi:hypothetical protein
MPIVSFPNSTVVNRAAKIFVYVNNTTASGTYYTLVNSTGVRGRISKITITSGSVSSQYMTIRVTIDGVQSTISPSAAATFGGVGLDHNNNAANVSLYFAGRSFDYYCDLTFLNSVQVEIMQNLGASQELISNVMYNQENN